MSRQIIFASFNKNKVKEVEEMLNIDPITLLSLSDFPGQHIPEAQEYGHSFKENAIIKARHYYNILNLPIISDDSGLVVPVLNNKPGIYSARYAGQNTTDKKNNDLLLKMLKHIPMKKRNAYFQAVVVYKDDTIEKVFNGKCEGLISSEPKGDFGFGYDPLFFVPELNKTFGELTIAEKSKISHRGMAVKALQMFLEKA